MLRIGQGFDVHAFAPQRKLVLCGVIVPCEFGLAGHSDADVALHAAMDALLGALALGDIGKFFPDSDAAYLNIDSVLLVQKLLAYPQIKAAKIHNLDLTIVAQTPKFAPYREQMRANTAKAFNLDIDQVSVKFTTTEKLGFCGRKEGIAASAIILLDA